MIDRPAARCFLTALRPRTRCLPGILIVALGTAGCSTLAAVLLDVPERTSVAPQQPGPVSATSDADASPARTRPRIESLTNRDSILAALPTDVAGSVDWAAALRDSVVDPRWSRPGGPRIDTPRGFGFDVVLKGPDPMFDASFPHSAHVEWASCDACHPAIIPYKGDPITMDVVNQGEACGRCHGPVAFPVSTCVRCHPQMPAFEAVDDPLGPDMVLARAGDGSAGAFPRARFPHWKHRMRYRCSACHPTLFAMRAGTDTLTMMEMGSGEACGACHDSNTAFGLVECTTCHKESE